MFWNKILFVTILLSASFIPLRHGIAEDAPNFTLKDLNGNTVRLSDQKGKVVFLDFWASWCPPCRRSMPEVEKLHEGIKNPNFAVYGINLEDDPEATKDFVARNGIKYTILIADGKVEKAYKIRGIPAFFLISPEGKIQKRYIGYAAGMEKEWISEINKLLGSTPVKPKGNPSKK